MHAISFVSDLDISQSLSLRDTPWNDVVMGIRTCELTDHCTIPALFPDIVAKTLQYMRHHGYQYVQFRIPPDKDKRRCLEQHGFYCAEMSYELSFHRVQRHSLPRINVDIEFIHATNETDLSLIRDIAYIDFHYGRLLEDVHVDDMASRLRTKHWIDVLRQAPYELFLAKSRGKPIGFHAQRPASDGSSVDWILTGTASKYAMLSLPLWQHAFLAAQQRGFQSIKTMISASNYKVLNIYNTFPFRVDSALCGYHTFLP